MVKDLDSWCDSDDVDSELEQEAYTMLYYHNFDNEKNDSPKKPDLTEKSLDALLNPASDSEICCLDFVNSSESIAEDEIRSNSALKDNSDSDVEYVKTVKCSNTVAALCVGSSSDDSDLENMNKTINSNNSSFLLNISTKNEGKKMESDSDSEVEYVKTVKCSNPVAALYVGSSSDDSDMDNIETTVNSTNSSFILNIKTEIKAKNPFSSSPATELNDSNRQMFKNNDSDDDKNWKVDIKPMEKSRRNSSRYFESVGKSNCCICSKKGHSESECTKSGPICILCGNEGHLSKHCDKAICLICYKTDHSVKKCPYTTEFLRQVCRRCGHRGHIEEICPDLWRQYKYATNPGPPLLQRCSSQNKSTVFCANCAKLGHFTEQCPRSRMNSRFIGPPPVMEIIKFEYCDIYKRAKLRYVMDDETHISDPTVGSEEEIGDSQPSFLEKMDITGTVGDFDNVEKVKVENDESSYELETSVNENLEKVSRKRKCKNDFGDGFIMLSPITKKNTRSTPAFKKPTTVLRSSEIACFSTPKPDLVSKHCNSEKEQIENHAKSTPSRLPGITTELLRKLFPEETENREKIPPVLRKKLRKRLKNLIYNGYLPGDSNLTQEKMEFWLQEISTGRNLNYREKKKLLGSVSAALHSISDRVSSVSDHGGDSMSFSKDNSRSIVGMSARAVEKKDDKKRRQRRSKSTGREERRIMEKVQVDIGTEILGEKEVGEERTEDCCEKENQRKPNKRRRRSNGKIKNEQVHVVVEENEVQENRDIERVNGENKEKQVETRRKSNGNSRLEQPLSIPDERKKRNKMNREEKFLKNSLKVSKKEKRENRKIQEETENSMRAKLRKSVSMETEMYSDQLRTKTESTNMRKKKRKVNGSSIQSSTIQID